VKKFEKNEDTLLDALKERYGVVVPELPGDHNHSSAAAPATEEEGGEDEDGHHLARNEKLAACLRDVEHQLDEVVEELVETEASHRAVEVENESLRHTLERVKGIARQTYSQDKMSRARVTALEREGDRSVIKFGTLHVRNIVLMQWGARRCFLRSNGSLEIVGLSAGTTTAGVVNATMEETKLVISSKSRGTATLGVFTESSSYDETSGAAIPSFQSFSADDDDFDGSSPTAAQRTPTSLFEASRELKPRLTAYFTHIIHQPKFIAKIDELVARYDDEAKLLRKLYSSKYAKKSGAGAVVPPLVYVNRTDGTVVLELPVSASAPAAAGSSSPSTPLPMSSGSSNGRRRAQLRPPAALHTLSPNKLFALQQRQQKGSVIVLTLSDSTTMPLRCATKSGSLLWMQAFANAGWEVENFTPLRRELQPNGEEGSRCVSFIYFVSSYDEILD
jgi:hypothetical protein